MLKFIKQILCKHNYVLNRKIYGDEINQLSGDRYEYICTKCKKLKWTKIAIAKLMRDYKFNKPLKGKHVSAGMYVVFQTTDNVYHYGKYDFNDDNARRFIDANTLNEYTSDLVIGWVEIPNNTK